MKRGTPRHPKILELSADLRIPHYSAVGLLEMLWHFTAEFALPGDIGKFSDDAIAQALCWDGASIDLVNALVHAGWLDRCECHRLRIHDWHEHSDQTVQRVLSKRNQEFLACYDDPSTVLAPSKMPLPKALSLKPIPKANTNTSTRDLIDGGAAKKEKPPSKKKKSKYPPGYGVPVWTSYSNGYEKRYGTPPIRNNKQNKMCCELRERLGEADSVDVANYYPSVQNSYHVARGHSLACLLADCEKIWTEWKTGKQITNTRANEADRLQSEGDGWLRAIEEVCDE